ncbi:hypothetical protein QBC44DRAFT_251716, partial [Cladorrhinum sp. PSN332]
IINRVRKGRVIIDLRPINKVAIPDNYPLPNQEKIINALIDYNYFIILNALAFFY